MDKKRLIFCWIILKKKLRKYFTICTSTPEAVLRMEHRGTIQKVRWVLNLSAMGPSGMNLGLPGSRDGL